MSTLKQLRAKIGGEAMCIEGIGPQSLPMSSVGWLLHADILVTHEAPGYHGNGFLILDTLARKMGVKVTVHGHQHDCQDSSERWVEQEFESFGLGLRGITAINSDGLARVVVPAELD